MKMMWIAGSTAALALSVSTAFAQAPGQKPPMKMDPKVGQCVQANQKEHASIMQMHAAATKARRLDAAEQAQFQKMETGLRAHQAALAKDGLTLAECEQISKHLSAEKATLAKMASTASSPVAQCVQHNNQEHAAIMQMHASATKARRLDAAEEATFKRMETGLRQHQAALAKGGLTLAECQQITKHLDGERAALAKMASTPPAAPKK